MVWNCKEKNFNKGQKNQKNEDYIAKNNTS
jgi:hypothetical protein